MAKYVVGVTGGIGSGKTTVTNLLMKKGIEVVDADIVAREVVAVGKPALKAIAVEFGDDILLENGELDRAKLREVIFSDNEKKQQLNQIMFPAIRTELLAQLHNAQSKYVVLSAALLLENNLNQYVDSVLVVDTEVAQQKNRAASRDSVQEAQIEAIINSQMSREQRLALADITINNTGSIEELIEQVENVHQQLLTAAQ